MAVTISVSDVRAALVQAGGRSAVPAEQATFTRQLGQWFHQIITELTQGESRQCVADSFSDLEPTLELWQQALSDLAYEQCVMPRLKAECAALQEAAREVLAFWQATKALCDWLASLCWVVHEERSLSGGVAWLTLTEWVTTEEELEFTLREPHWTDSVKLVGIADAVLRPTPSGRALAIEFKLGESAPAADLGQACLYQLMLSAARETSAATSDALALVRFTPARNEQLFDAAQLEAARQALIEHVGRVAGVIPGQPLPVAPLHEEAARLPETTVTAEHRELGLRLIKACAEFSVTATLAADPIVGPTFLRFPLTLGRGQKVAPVKKLPEDLQTRLKLDAVPFVMQDRGQLVIDVQRPDRQSVPFAAIRAQLPHAVAGVRQSQAPIGVDLEGRLQCLDFAKTEHAHVLVAGTTGSGKSEWLRTAIAGLIVSNTPETLRLLLIDPKRNAFHALRQSPFLWQPIVYPDEQSAVDVLEKLADEMDRRYRLMEGCDAISQLMVTTADPLPRVVCVIDEYFDLISRNKKERKAIEEQVFRLGAKARAAGIPLVIATQQPSRSTIQGALDANIPARIGLKMGKAIESRMLLTEAGAERLLGHGDLLFKDLGAPRRLQAALLSSEERTAIFG